MEVNHFKSFGARLIPSSPFSLSLDWVIVSTALPTGSKAKVVVALILTQLLGKVKRNAVKKAI